MYLFSYSLLNSYILFLFHSLLVPIWWILFLILQTFVYDLHAAYYSINITTFNICCTRSATILLPCDAVCYKERKATRSGRSRWR
jgi:hypothetical protein